MQPKCKQLCIQTYWCININTAAEVKAGLILITNPTDSHPAFVCVCVYMCTHIHSTLTYTYIIYILVTDHDIHASELYTVDMENVRFSNACW